MTFSIPGRPYAPSSGVGVDAVLAGRSRGALGALVALAFTAGEGSASHFSPAWGPGINLSLIATALIAIMWTYAIIAARRELRVEWLGLKLLMCAGVAEGFAYVMMWRALASGTVAVVSPLTNSHSIFAVALAALFLRDLERVTWRIGVATVLIVAGVMVVLRFGTG